MTLSKPSSITSLVPSQRPGGISDDLHAVGIASTRSVRIRRRKLPFAINMIDLSENGVGTMSKEKVFSFSCLLYDEEEGSSVHDFSMIEDIGCVNRVLQALNPDRLNPSTFRLDDSYYLDPLPYSSYSAHSYPFRPPAQSHSSSSNVYFSSHPHPFSPTATQLTHADLTSYATYDTTYFNVAVAAAYQHGYPSHYHSTTTADSFDITFSRPLDSLHRGNDERQLDVDPPDRKASTSTAQPSRKRKLPDETIKAQYESEPCRVCDDASSGYHFGVFTCEACKGFFRRYSKKSTVLDPCPTRCGINKNNRNNCAACRFDKCKHVGMALDKIRFGKPPKIFRASASTPGVKLEPSNHDFQLMLRLLECYQSFDEYEQQPSTTTTTTSTHSSIIFQFCHRLADIVMPESDRAPETFRARLKRHESALKFLITGENDQNASSWSKEPQAWVFAHNERWRLIMILLILAFDDEQIGGGPFACFISRPSSPLDANDNSFHAINDTVIERILRLFELECDQEKEARTVTEGSASYTEKNMKCMKAQFILRFVDMMTNDMISNKGSSSVVNRNFTNPYLEPTYRNHLEMIYAPSVDGIQAQQTVTNQPKDVCSENLG